MAENSLSDLINFIGTDVYGREMREHICDAFRILANSSLSTAEKEKIADLVIHPPVLYTPQVLTEGEKIVARNNIGAAKAGDSGRGWTEEQIGLFENFKDELTTVFAKIGYKDNSASGAGQTAARAAIDQLDALIESLRAVPVELLSITLALKDGVSPIAGRAITGDELVVTGHYSVGPDREIESGYNIEPEMWAYPSTDVIVKYNDITSNSITVPVAREPAATISIDNDSDTDRLVVTVGLGGLSIPVSKGNPYPVYDEDMDKRVEVVIQVKSAQSGKYVIDDSTEVTMVGGEMSKTGMGVYSTTSITGNIVIKAISKALPERIDATYTGGTVPAGTTLAQLTGITVKAVYSDASQVTLTASQYSLSGTLTPGQTNTVTVTGLGDYAGKTTTFGVTVEQEVPAATRGTGTSVIAAASKVLPTATLTWDGDASSVVPNKVTATYRNTGGIMGGLNINTVVLLKNAAGNWKVTSITNGASGNRNLTPLEDGDTPASHATIKFGANNATISIKNVYAKYSGTIADRDFAGGASGTHSEYDIVAEVV